MNETDPQGRIPTENDTTPEPWSLRDKELLSKDDLKFVLTMSNSGIERRCRLGELRPIYLDRRPRFTWAEITRFVEACEAASDG